MTIGIYKITNNINGHCYIGQSSQIEKRWKNHKIASNNQNDSSYEYPLYKAMRKYGIENFTFEIIEECLIEELDEREIYWIKYYNPEYNKTIGGNRNIVPQKLTFEQVKEIQNILMNLTEDDNIFHKDIAAQYGVHRDTIRDINMGNSWHDDTLEYPLHKSKFRFNTKKIWLCKDCGKEVSKGAERCSSCANKFRVQENIKMLPVTREELKEEIRTTSFLALGRKYGVTDNSIRKWCKKLNLPFKSTEIKNYTDDEWEKI